MGMQHGTCQCYRRLGLATLISPGSDLGRPINNTFLPATPYRILRWRSRRRPMAALVALSGPDGLLILVRMLLLTFFERLAHTAKAVPVSLLLLEMLFLTLCTPMFLSFPIQGVQELKDALLELSSVVFSK